MTIAVRAPGPDDDRLLASGELALRVGGERTSPGLYRQTLIEDSIAWLVRAARRVPRTLSLADYARRGRVRVARRGANPRVDRALADAGLPPPDTVIVQTLLAAVMVVARSDRVLAVSGELALALSRALPVRMVEPPIALDPISIAQHWHARVHTDPAHAWLRACIKRIADRRVWRRPR